jgi:hypothetical protein
MERVFINYGKQFPRQGNNIHRKDAISTQPFPVGDQLKKSRDCSSPTGNYPCMNGLSMNMDYHREKNESHNEWMHSINEK